MSQNSRSQPTHKRKNFKLIHISKIQKNAWNIQIHTSTDKVEQTVDTKPRKKNQRVGINLAQGTSTPLIIHVRSCCQVKRQRR